MGKRWLSLLLWLLPLISWAEHQANHPLVLTTVDSYAPLTMVDSYGDSSGLINDLWALWSEKTGIPIKIQPKPWPKTLETMRAGEVDVHAAIYITAGRQEWLDFSSPFYEVEASLWFLPGKVSPPTALNNRYVGVMLNSYASEYLSEYHPQIRQLSYTSMEALIDALLRQEVDAFVGETAIIQHKLLTQGLLNKVERQRQPLFARQLYAAVKKGNTDLLKRINEGFKQISAQERLAIEQRWVTNSDLQMYNRHQAPASLTLEEQDWLGRHNSLRIAALNWPPLMTGSLHNPKGILPAYLNSLSEAYRLELTYLPYQSWDEAIQALERNEVDVVPGIPTSSLNNSMILASQPLPYSWVFLNNGKLLPDDPNSSIGYISNRPIIRHLYGALGYDKTLVPFSILGNAINALEQGEVDNLLLNEAEALYAKNTSGNARLRILELNVTTPLRLAFATSSATPQLNALINYYLTSLTEYDHNAIRQEWITNNSGISWEEFWRWLSILVIATVLLIMTMLYWNRRLKSEIGQRRQTERELINAKQEAESADKAKSEFLATMSHEIRTPMNAILGMTELSLASLPADTELSENLRTIQDASRHLLHLINDVLDLSRIEAGKLTLDSQPLALDALLDRLVRGLSPLVNDKPLELSWNRAASISNWILGDPTRLQQILVNLLGNAVKFTNQGSIQVLVQLERTPELEDRLRFSVIDTGIGIAPDKLEHIFEAFTQADQSTTRQYGGSGLGLTICKRLVNLMGGEISVESELGQGTTFSFWIPYPPCDAPQESITTTGKAKLDRPLRILLAEDNLVNRKVALKMLELLGQQADTAGDGEEAIQALKRTPYDLVLMDIEMPYYDGIQITERLRSGLLGDLNLRTPVYALTAHTLNQHQQDCQRAGMNGFISKPIQLQNLRDVLESFPGPNR
ncbi:ATP-binding protein [Balneatrix alpica]|uniref:histidine kinase n=1 Tax=Balneatrix alpica TaxID=75684 RepID=A0ABV5ZB18_9GAMM|nr:transporter substrate-binding domain-containing protein [Balneatrix alpica]